MNERGWRVGHQGRDRMYYEELRDGAWRRIDLDGEMLMGRAHHVIYFASLERWLLYPEWARDRRSEIIARVTSELRPPDYEYLGLDAAPPSAAPMPIPTPTPGPAPLRAAPAKPTPPQGRRALLLASALLLALAAAMGGLVMRGLASGETRLPVKQSSLRRPISRQQEPAMFWTSIGLYAAVGTSSLSLGALGLRAFARLSR